MQFLTPFQSFFQEGLDMSDPEPVDLLSEHLGDTEAKEGPGVDHVNPTNNDFMGDDDDDGETQIFKQAVQHSKPDLMQSPHDEL